MHDYPFLACLANAKSLLLSSQRYADADAVARYVQCEMFG
jgi:hypothetical protein